MEMILGIPDLRGALVDRAREMRATVLVSVNRLAVRRKDRLGLPVFQGFDCRKLAGIAGLDACLDSAGFVAMVRYRGFDWTVAQYVGVGAAWPWRWFASMDACVEQEVAPNRDVVLDRIAWTVALNHACRAEARAQGCADRLMPVIQGARSEDYLRCLDQMPWAADEPILGVGSMCRRHTHGLDGILAAVDCIDRALGSAPARLHLFGVKSDAAEALRAHPRVASGDSQAYGSQARGLALAAGVTTKGQGDLFQPGRRFSKTDTFTAGVMRSWMARQSARLSRRGEKPAVGEQLDLTPHSAPPHPWLARLGAAREQMRALVAAGELDWPDLNDRWAWEWAVDLDDGDAG